MAQVGPRQLPAGKSSVVMGNGMGNGIGNGVRMGMACTPVHITAA